MVGLLAVAAHVVAGFRFATTDAQTLMWVAIVSGVVNLWSYGVLRNYERDPETPPAAAIANTVTFVTGAALLIWSFVG